MEGGRDGWRVGGMDEGREKWKVGGMDGGRKKWRVGGMDEGREEGLKTVERCTLEGREEKGEEVIL